MASAGSITVDSTGEIIFNYATDDGACTTFMVRCVNSSSNKVLVNIEGLHKSGEFFPIEIGETQYFRVNHMGIKSVFAKGSGGDADIDYGVVAKTRIG